MAIKRRLYSNCEKLKISLRNYCRIENYRNLAIDNLSSFSFVKQIDVLTLNELKCPLYEWKRVSRRRCEESTWTVGGYKRFIQIQNTGPSKLRIRKLHRQRRGSKTMAIHGKNFIEGCTTGIFTVNKERL